MTPIVNVGYSSTNYYVLGQGRDRLLVDVGMPGSLPRLLANLKRMDVALEQIGYLFATHYHPDHAGIAQELIERGVRLLIFPEQLAAVPLLRRYVKPDDPFKEIQLANALQLTIAAGRAFLQTIGVAGEFFYTPGHSDDSMSLVLDTGEAFIGDLSRPDIIDEPTIQRSWEILRRAGASRIYPGHGPVLRLESER